MTGIGLGFGAGLAVIGIVAAASPQRVYLLTGWFFLFLGWVVAAFWVRARGPDALWTWPIMDAIFGALCIGIALEWRQRWAWAIAALFFAQTLRHIAWSMSNVTEVVDAARLYNYQLDINRLLAGQMFCIAFAGIRAMFIKTAAA